MDLNICLMNDSFPPTIDGVANAVVNYAKHITLSHGKCVVATPDYPGVTDDYPFPVVRYPSLDTTQLTGYRAGNPLAPETIETLRRMDCNLIHSHCPVASTVLARALRDASNVPIVFTYHTKFDIDIAKAVRSKLVQQAAIDLLVANVSACDEVWVVSEGAGENLRSLGYQGDFLVMPNGVDLDRGEADPAAVQPLSAEWDLPGGVPVFLFLGRMMWYKGLRIILDGLKRYRDAGHDFRMVFVGDGQDRAEVEAYANEIGLADVCRFTGAVHDRETVRAWYCRADLLLFPSTFDTNGLVVREAAACGLGSVLVRGSCAAEGVTDGRNGILIDENAESLAAVLSAESMGIETFRAVGQNAMGELYLSWADSVANAAERYQIVLERRARGELKIKQNAAMHSFYHLQDTVRETAGAVKEAAASMRGTAAAMRENAVGTIRETATEVRTAAVTQLIRELGKAQEYLERYL